MLELIAVGVNLYETTSSHFQPLHLNAIGAHLRKIVMRLLRQPAFRIAAEGLGKTHGYFRRNAALFIYQFR